MLKSTTSWTTSDGKVHTNHLTALKHELVGILAKAGGTEAVARRIVESLDKASTENLIAHLNAIKQELPGGETLKLVHQQG